MAGGVDLRPGQHPPKPHRRGAPPTTNPIAEAVFAARQRLSSVSRKTQ